MNHKTCYDLHTHTHFPAAYGRAGQGRRWERAAISTFDCELVVEVATDAALLDQSICGRRSTAFVCELFVRFSFFAFESARNSIHTTCISHKMVFNMPIKTETQKRNGFFLSHFSVAFASICTKTELLEKRHGTGRCQAKCEMERCEPGARFSLYAIYRSSFE